MPLEVAYSDPHILRFTGYYSDDMPHLASVIFTLMRNNDDTRWIYLRALLDELIRVDVLPPRVSLSGQYKIVQNLLREAVEVDGETLALARIQTIARGARGWIVVRLPYPLPEERPLQPRDLEFQGPPDPPPKIISSGPVAEAFGMMEERLNDLEARLRALENLVIDNGGLTP